MLGITIVIVVSVSLCWERTCADIYRRLMGISRYHSKENKFECVLMYDGVYIGDGSLIVSG